MILAFAASLLLAVNGANYVCKSGEVIDYLQVTGNDITVVDCRIRFPGSPQPGINGVQVTGNRVTLRRLIVERSGGTGIYFLSGTGHILEDSVIRDPARRQGFDATAIYSATSGTVTIRRNTVYGSGYSQMATGSAVIEDNHFIVPEDYRTDCKGNIERDGPCQCAEEGVTLKSGNVIVRHNVISGYRQSDPVCGGSGSPGIGVSLAPCSGTGGCTVDNIVIENNVISDSTFGVYVLTGTSNLRVEGNRFCHNQYGISDGFGDPSAIVDNEFLGNTVNLTLYGSRTGPVSGNRLVASCGL